MAQTVVTIIHQQQQRASANRMRAAASGLYPPAGRHIFLCDYSLR